MELNLSLFNKFYFSSIAYVRYSHAKQILFQWVPSQQSYLWWISQCLYLLVTRIKDWKENFWQNSCFQLLVWNCNTASNDYFQTRLWRWGVVHLFLKFTVFRNDGIQGFKALRKVVKLHTFHICIMVQMCLRK